MSQETILEMFLTFHSVMSEIEIVTCCGLAKLRHLVVGLVIRVKLWHHFNLLERRFL